MLFMVIEHFHNSNAKAIYARYREHGRQLPDGLEFVASWVAADLSRCFQVMKCDDVALLQRWVSAWSDVTKLEIVPVTTGADTARVLSLD